MSSDDWRAFLHAEIEGTVPPDQMDEVLDRMVCDLELNLSALPTSVKASTYFMGEDGYETTVTVVIAIDGVHERAD